MYEPDLTMSTNTHETQSVLQEAVMMSLLIAYVIKPDDILRQRILGYATTVPVAASTFLISARQRIGQHERMDPMLWFKLLRVIREGKYDVSTLMSFGLIDTDKDPSKNRTSIKGLLMANSPHPHATWIMSERYACDTKSSETVLYGPLNNLRLIKKAKKNIRAFSIVSHDSKPELVYLEEKPLS